MNGVIWSKTQKTFVPISSVPVFAMMQQERLRQSRALEIHNFQLQNLTVTSFQESHFFEFYDNDTKVRGLCGQLWNLLSEKLNFTLQAIRSNEISVGVSEKNRTVFNTGLLGILFRNETIAIPKVEMHDVRLAATDFTMPLWMNSQRAYIQHEVVHDSTWMTEVFSQKIWWLILITLLLMSVCSFWSQTVYSRIENNCKRSTFGDHVFYNFGMICNQIKTANRLIIAPTVETMFKLACEDRKYTIFQGEDDHKVRHEIGCHMIPVGKSYLKMWVASGIVKNFKYKRTIDLG
ncbi:hypothetical protein ALC62_10210 [Cyphomyrmex costatus]|uniref:Uncharacterized protein n=1 Tax=Cyphomyrmex costatus TaxID=456900 RepID=A0A195CFK5_9HYME|nr:hypothetical protein ALC62_10210 [Cyphomyrmex costatus]